MRTRHRPVPQRPSPKTWRTLLLMALCAGFALPAQSRELAFEVLLDGKPIGSHTFILTPEGDGESVKSSARFDVKVLGIRLYRYRHEATEQWQRGCLQRLEATTDDNGDALAVRGARSGSTFELQQPRPATISAGCVSTYAYWNLDRLRQQQNLLNPQTGKWEPARLESLGVEELQRKGVRIMAQHHRLHAGELTIDLWHSPEGEWLQLASPAKGNRKLLYRLRE